MSSVNTSRTSRVPLFTAIIFLVMTLMILSLKGCASEENKVDRLAGQLEQCKADLALVVDRCFNQGAKQ